MNREQEQALREALAANPLAVMILATMHQTTAEEADIEQLKACDAVVQAAPTVVKDSVKAQTEAEARYKAAYTEWFAQRITAMRGWLSATLEAKDGTGVFDGKSLLDVAEHNAMFTLRAIIETKDHDGNPLPQPRYALAGVFNNGAEKKPYYVDAAGISKEERTRAVRKNSRQTKAGEDATQSESSDE